MDKAALFVDVQNIYYTCRDALGGSFDYRNLWTRLSNDNDIVIANAYAIERDHAGQKKFQHALSELGFEVKLKPFIQRADGSAKGDWDVGITIDVLEAAHSVDHIILLSGDGDFDLLLEKISATTSASTTVFGVPDLTAASLIDAATHFIPIDESMLIKR